MRAIWLPDFLRKWGIPTVVETGWETRGRDDFDPWGHVRHHDASPEGADLGFLSAIIFGRAGLSGPLANLFLPRGLTAAGRAVRVVAAGTANHAGAGGWKGLRANRQVVGTEGANSGLGEPWTAWQQDMWPLVDAAVIDGIRSELGRDVGAEWCCDHREWAPGRKVDRAGFDPADQRRRAAVLLAAGPAGPQPHPEEDLAMPMDNELDRVEWPGKGKAILAKDGSVYCFGVPSYGNVNDLRAEFRMDWPGPGAIVAVDPDDPAAGYRIYNRFGAEPGYTFDVNTAPLIGP